MAFTLKNAEDYYTTPVNAETNNIYNLTDKNIKKYITKTIIAGEMLECEIYPTWKTKPLQRGSKINPSRKAQANLNNNNTKKNLVRLINSNFTKEDIWLTFTYDNEHLPDSPEQARRDIRNCIRRLRTQAKKLNYPPLKYVYVTEYSEDEPKKRVHHHMIINFRDRDLAEKIWDKGGRTHSRRLQPDDYGLEGLARYITKDPKNKKSYSTSKNLIPPVVYTDEGKIKKRQANNIARNKNLAQEVFENMYPGYTFNDIEVKSSPYVSGAYIYARMRYTGANEKKGRRSAHT